MTRPPPVLLPRLSAALLPALLFGAACGDHNANPLDTGDSVDTADSSADSGVDSGVDTGEAGPPPCGTYNDVGHLGSVTVWTYYLGGRRTSTEMTWDPTTGMATTESESTTNGPDYLEVAHGLSERRCDTAGLWALHEYAEWTRTASDGAVSTGWTDRSYGEALLGPADLAVGVSWTDESTTTITEQIDGVDQEPEVEVISADFTVTQATTIDIEAGTFEVLEVEGTVRGNATLFYLAEGIGVIKNASGEMSSYTE